MWSIHFHHSSLRARIKKKIIRKLHEGFQPGSFFLKRWNGSLQKHYVQWNSHHNPIFGLFQLLFGKCILELRNLFDFFTMSLWFGFSEYCIIYQILKIIFYNKISNKYHIIILWYGASWFHIRYYWIQTRMVNNVTLGPKLKVFCKISYRSYGVKLCLTWHLSIFLWSHEWNNTNDYLNFYCSIRKILKVRRIPFEYGLVYF